MKNKSIYSIGLIFMLLFVYNCEKDKNKANDHFRNNTKSDSIYFKGENLFELINVKNINFLGNLQAGTYGDADFGQGYSMALELCEKDSITILSTCIRIGSAQREMCALVVDTIKNNSIRNKYIKIIKNSDPINLKCIKGFSPQGGSTGFAGYLFTFLNKTDSNSVILDFGENKYLTQAHRNLSGLFSDTSLFIFTINQLQDSLKYNKIYKYLNYRISKNLGKKPNANIMMRKFSKTI